MSGYLDRAGILINQSRYADAEGMLRRAIGDDPYDGAAYALLALSLSGQEKHDEALQAAREAVRIAPDAGFTHYVLAGVHVERKEKKKAREAIDEAIRLDPDDADFFARQSSIHLMEENWPDALKAAERGLDIDPEHRGSANLRSIALVKLGRKREAEATVQWALSRDPEDALSHANMGWSLLHQGRHREAAKHFREALRIDPDLEWARAGVLEALKARHFIYRQILRYFLWMSRLTTGQRWGVVIGLYVAFRLLRAAGRIRPELAPIVYPLVGFYVGFVFLSWAAIPLFNLLLRLHPFGKLALSRDERRGANLVGLFLLAGLVCAGFGLAPLVTAAEFGESSFQLVMAGLVLVVMIIPVAGAVTCPPGRGRLFLGLYAAALLLLGLSPQIIFLISGNLFVPGLGAFFIGLFAYSWIANVVHSKE